MLTTLVFISLAFGLIGGLMASLVIYAEYRRHRLPRRKLLNETLRAGVVAFVLLTGLTLVATYVIARVLNPTNNALP